MWIQSEDGTIYNADKFSFFGIDRSVTTQSSQSSDTAVVHTEWSYYIFGTIQEPDVEMVDYLMANGFPTEEDAQVELNRFLRHIKVGDNVFRFCKED